MRHSRGSGIVRSILRKSRKTYTYGDTLKNGCIPSRREKVAIAILS